MSQFGGWGSLRFRLVSGFFLLYMPLRVTRHNVCPSCVTVVDGAFAALVLSVWAGVMVVCASFTLLFLLVFPMRPDVPYCSCVRVITRTHQQ